MARHSAPSDREFAIAKVLRTLGKGSLSRSHAESAGKLLGVHWTTIYRLRKRFLAEPVASSVSRGLRALLPGTEGSPPRQS